MANGNTYGILPSAQNVLDMPYLGISPFAPAGIPDIMRQGWLTGLEGLAAQYDPSVAYATNMANLAGQSQNWFQQGMQGGFGWNPLMGLAAQGAMQSANQPYFGAAGNLYGQSLAPGGFNTAAMLTNQATNPAAFNLAADLTQDFMTQPGFSTAAGQVGSTLGAFGQPGSTTAAIDEINRATGGPGVDMGTISAAAAAANRALQRDFDLTTLQDINRGVIASGPGGYGSTRAGVAEGIARGQLADAMERQTTEMFMRGALQGQQLEEQNRQANLQAALESQRLGGQFGMTGAQTLANIANMQGALGLGGAGQIGDLGQAYANLMLGAGGQLGNLAQAYGGLQQGAAGGLANLGQAQGNLGLAASGQLGDLGLASLNAMNQMGQWGYGSMLPAAYQGAFQAGMVPGDVMGQMGQMMTGIGAQQQAQNQNIINWYNQAYNQMAGYPWQQMAQYQNLTQPFTSPGTITNATGPIPPGTSPIGNALMGAQAGMGLYNMFRQNQQQQMPNWGSNASLGGSSSNWLAGQHGTGSGSFLG